MRALAVIALAPAFAAGAVMAAVGIVGGPVKQAERPSSLVWSDRVFPNRQSFATWLRARGGDYPTWAARHPSLARVFDPSVVRQPADVRPAATRRTSHSWWVALVAGVALALLAALYALRSRLGTVAAPRRPRHLKRMPRPRPAPHAPLLAAATVAAARVPSSLATSLHELKSRRVRHLLPSLAFYVTSIVLAIVIGASVAIYFE